MITIEYAENGQAVSDFNYKDWLDVGQDSTQFGIGLKQKKRRKDGRF
jgi:hypothetical protein